MRGMMEMWAVRVRIQGKGLGMQEMRVGMWGMLGMWRMGWE